MKADIGIYLIAIFAFLMLYLLFTTHAVAVENTKIAYYKAEESLAKAKLEQNSENIAYYESTLRINEWAKDDVFTFDDGLRIGGISGVIVGIAIFFACKFITRMSTKISSDIGSSMNFLLCCITGIIFISCTFLTLYFAHEHMLYAYIDAAIVSVDSLILTFVVYFYFTTKNRLADFTNVKNQGDNFRASIDIKTKHWTQILQSLVFVSLTIVFLVYVVNFIQEEDRIFEKLNEDYYMAWLTYNTFLVGMQVFGIFFGLIGRIVWYIGKLSYLLRDVPDHSA